MGVFSDQFAGGRAAGIRADGQIIKGEFKAFLDWENTGVIWSAGVLLESNNLKCEIRPIFF